MGNPVRDLGRPELHIEDAPSDVHLESPLRLIERDGELAELVGPEALPVVLGDSRVHQGEREGPVQCPRIQVPEA